MKILYIGDVSGSLGREILQSQLSKIILKYRPNVIVANVENASGGIGVSRESVEEILAAGVDLCTGGDHTYRIKDFVEELSDENLPFLRPANFEAKDIPGRGYEVIDFGSDGKVAFINLLGQELFTHTQRVRSPFWYVDELFEKQEIAEADIKIVEIHAESAAEKLSLAWYLRDRADAVVGTHTHVATADNRILGGKIAYVTDIGQVGSYEASLWVDFESTIHNFRFPDRKQFKVKKGGPGILNSVLIEFDKKEEIYSPKSIQRVDIVVE